MAVDSAICERRRRAKSTVCRRRRRHNSRRRRRWFVERTSRHHITIISIQLMMLMDVNGWMMIALRANEQAIEWDREDRFYLHSVPERNTKRHKIISAWLTHSFCHGYSCHDSTSWRCHCFKVWDGHWVVFIAVVFRFFFLSLPQVCRRNRLPARTLLRLCKTTSASQAQSVYTIRSFVYVIVVMKNVQFRGQTFYLSIFLCINKIIFWFLVWKKL